MGDIILNVFSLVDKRLNRLKGLKMKTKSDLDVILPQYEKINEILNNAKKLLLKDPGDVNYIQQNIAQIDIRLKIVESEKKIIFDRILFKDYDDDDILTISASSFISSSFLKSPPPPQPHSISIGSSHGSSNSNTTTTTTTTPPHNNTIQFVKEEVSQIKPTELSNNNISKELEKTPTTKTEQTQKSNIKNLPFVDECERDQKQQQNEIDDEKNPDNKELNNPTESSDYNHDEKFSNPQVEIEPPILTCNLSTTEVTEIKQEDSSEEIIINVKPKSLNRQSIFLDQEKIRNLNNNSILEEKEEEIKEKNNLTHSLSIENLNISSTSLPSLSPLLNNMNTSSNSTTTTTTTSPGINKPYHSPPFHSGKLDIEEDNLNNTLMSTSLVDTFLLKYKGRSGSDLSISQFIQPFMIPSESQLQQIPKQPPLSSSVPYSSFFAKTSQQKISQKLKLAKNIHIRKVSDAKIGHARSNSLAKINYSSSDYDLNQHQQPLEINQLSASTPGKIVQRSMFLQNSNNSTSTSNNSSNSNSLHTSSNSTNNLLYSSVNHNIQNNNNNNSSINNNTEGHVGQGERLALLQSLLKSEELTNNAERKVIDEINNRTRLKSQELYQLVWEVRHLDKAIAHILNNRLKISDLSDISFSDLKIPGSPNSKSNGKDSNNSNPPQMNYYQKENGSAVIELSSSLKYSLERLVILLRTEPSILRDTLHRADYLGVELDNSFKSSHTDLSQAIVFSLFGNCFTATDEKLLLLLIKSITELEFKMVKDKKSFGTHEPFSFTLVSTYLNYTYGKPYIISVLKDLIVSIIQDHNINLENDPQKKAMLAQIGILEEPEIDQHLLLQQFTGEFLKRAIALSSGIPYALRWMSKVIIQLWRDHLKASRPVDFQPSEITLQKDRLDEREFIIHLVFENFFIPALIRPDHYGVLTGLTISHKARHNLIQIAKMVLDFIRQPLSIPVWIRNYFGGDMDRVFDEYFMELIQVEEPETYYHRPIFELELGQDLLVSSTDLFIILELIFHNHPDPNVENPDETHSLQKEVVEMIKKVQPASQLQEGMKFLVINVLPKLIDQNEQSSKSAAKQLDPPVRLAKENLILALSVLSFLCGYSSCGNICELLLLQCGRSRSLELNILEAQIEETIRSLWALPEVYKQNDYQLLLDSMFDDYYKREKKRSLEKQLKVLYLDQLQRHTSQITSQKNINIEFLTNQKFRLFRDKIYARMQTEFVSDFMTQFSQHTGACDCEPLLEDTVTCKICTLKSNQIKAFLTKSKNTLAQSEWWRSATDDDLNFASNTLERNLLTQIYNFTFNVSKHDIAFSKDLASKFSSIDHTLLYIPEKYSNQAPWELAQQELKKINLYKSPHDKMKCIIDTWNIIFNYTKPLGESGPDDFLPIMGYVIIKSRPENILSNIQYIQLYAELDDDHEIWFMNLKSSIEIVKEVLKDAKSIGWRKGILSLTSQRMENMLKEIKKKEKLKKWRTSIVRLESNSPVLQQLQSLPQLPTNINSQL